MEKVVGVNEKRKMSFDGKENSLKQTAVVNEFMLVAELSYSSHSFLLQCMRFFTV